MNLLRKTSHVPVRYNGYHMFAL
uniref:Uncharacterized protein n=1 Tax=Arundo donax TaxID=35708 RepID=A0A0A8XQG7_ARUDO